jgi:hypothetical protein
MQRKLSHETYTSGKALGQVNFVTYKENSNETLNKWYVKMAG